MAERRFAQSDDFQSAIRTNDGTIVSDLVSNPGSTPTEVAASTALNQLVVNQVLAFGLKAGVFVARADFSGVVRYWRADTWALRILNFIGHARDWADALSPTGAMEGALVTDLVTNHGLAANEAEALATALVNTLVNEGTGETA